MSPLSATIDFFHYRLFEILFLETWAKGNIMYLQIKSIMKDID